MLLIHILLVDDFDAWRNFVRSILEKETQCGIICEASDGIEAVQKALELKPDLVLMDIGLPKLNGIDAARKIVQFAPKPQILFLSQESSEDVVREALTIGKGFVVKADAGRELTSAVKTVVQGKPFISSKVAADTYSAAFVSKGYGLKARLLRLGRKSRSHTEYLKGTNIRLPGGMGK